MWHRLVGHRSVLVVLLTASLYNQYSVSGCWYRLVVIPVCPSVCLSGECTVVKQLIGSGCRLVW